jgi:hypothetical protein
LRQAVFPFGANGSQKRDLTGFGPSGPPIVSLTRKDGKSQECEYIQAHVFPQKSGCLDCQCTFPASPGTPRLDYFTV